MGEWDWELTDTSRRDFGDLDDHARDRIASKLDEIVTDDWRNPPEHLEPLQGGTAPETPYWAVPTRLSGRP